MRPFRFATILSAALLLAACAPSAPVASPQPQSVPPARGDITASCGGGFTGGGQGITIRADDHVISWRQITAGEQHIERDLGADAAFAADIRRQLGMIHFADVSYQETGNMTCSLSAGDHVVSWPQGDPRAPGGVLDIHELVFTADGRE